MKTGSLAILSGEKIKNIVFYRKYSAVFWFYIVSRYVIGSKEKYTKFMPKKFVVNFKITSHPMTDKNALVLKLS